MNQFHDEVLVQYLKENFPNISLSADQLNTFFLDLFFTVHWRCHDQMDEEYTEFVDVTYKKNDSAGSFLVILYFDENEAIREGWPENKIELWITEHRQKIKEQFFEYLDDFLVQFIQSYDFGGLGGKEG